MEQTLNKRLLLRGSMQEVEGELERWKKRVWTLLRVFGHVGVDVDYDAETVEVLKCAGDAECRFPLSVGIEFTGVYTEFSVERFDDGMRIVEASLTSRARALDVLAEVLERHNYVRLNGVKGDSMMWVFRKRVEPRTIEEPLHKARGNPEEWKARLEELMTTGSIGTVTIRIENDGVRAVWGRGKLGVFFDLEATLRARGDGSTLYEEVVIGYKRLAFKEAVRLASMSIWPRSCLLREMRDALGSYNLISVEARREKR
ncbi:hypothetical protein [Thermofilum sp.]|jgi:hypothetical protein|uniref:hypothetical protein n=1 Tax=Thermofilum sp. TaxID=1961369 RepID=UPI00258DFDC9|nr:hypothetical protein [Thermofilum sp.]